MSDLLNRDQFRASVFSRDGYKCVICGAKDKLDAHHIIERRLWHDGGYYLDNGATLCSEYSGYVHDGISCHMKAEMTVLSCDEIRAAAGITKIIIPEHMYSDQQYDKWGNIIMPDGSRIRGELFDDESVQKVLKQGGYLDQSNIFRQYVKYPRTYHLPWSEGVTEDDRLAHDHQQMFGGKEVIVTEKMDGENTTMYRDHIHARSIDSGSHPSRGWVKNFHGKIAHDIPEDWRICGENLYARHTLPYEDLNSFFLCFSIWDHRNFCLSWDDTIDYAEMLDLKMVPVLYRGLYENIDIPAIHKSLDFTKQEGYVIRIADEFPYRAFRHSIAKFVRRAHVGTAHHWMMQAVTPNQMKKA